MEQSMTFRDRDNSQNIIHKAEKIQKTYYNNIASIYDKYHCNNYSLILRRDIFDVLLKGINIDFRRKIVLDAMCGGGQSSIYFKNKDAIVKGFDISEEQCNLYSLRHPDSEVFCCSVLDTPFKDNSFDFIVTDSLHHIFPETNRGLDEISRILKPNGYFMIWEPSANSFIDKLRVLWQKNDSKYFQTNEQSINLKAISEYLLNRMSCKNFFFGGNIGYLLITSSMILRIPEKIVKYYAPFLIPIERSINKLQPSFLSFYVAALFQKK
jgi:ubiquinone/menaquinone biosynthesis C-methylase UbiE